MDLNIMMREQAKAGLQAQLDTAVTNGDTAAARKAADDLAKLELQTAPKAPAYGDVEIKAALTAKAPWFGVDPRKSGKCAAFGRDMDPRKFATAEAFAEALIKAVDEEFKPAVADAEPDADPDADPAEDPPARDKKPQKKTDGPGEADTLGAGAASRGKSGPWTKISDAPPEVRKEINRTADKFAPKTKEGREKYIDRALEAHYAVHMRTKGKK